MTRPTLSVLVPTRNRAAWLRECLATLQAAPFDGEILVADNASSDETPAVAAACGQLDARLRYVRHERDLGLIGNHRFLLNAAQGRYVCLLGDDDTVEPLNFARKLAVLEAQPHLGLIYSLAFTMDADGRRLGIRGSFGMARHSYLGGRDEFRALLLECHLPLQSLVFRRELWERAGDVDESLGLAFDWDLLLRFCRGTPTAFLAEPLVSVREHPQQLSVTAGASQGQLSANYLNIWRKWLLDVSPLPVLGEWEWRQMAQNLMGVYRHFEEAADPARKAALEQALAEIKARHLERQQAWCQVQLDGTRAASPPPAS